MPYSKAENLVALGVPGETAKAIAAPKAAVNALALVTSPNATDLATAITLSNEQKVVINAMIAALKVAD